MANTLEFQSSDLISLPKRGQYDLFFNVENQKSLGISVSLSTTSELLCGKFHETFVVLLAILLPILFIISCLYYFLNCFLFCFVLKQF